MLGDQVNRKLQVEGSSRADRLRRPAPNGAVSRAGDAMTHDRLMWDKVMIKKNLRHRRQAGVALIMALLFLCIFGALAVALVTSADLGLQMSGNHRQVMDARLAAESGLDFFACLLRTTAIADASTGQSILDSLAADWADKLNGSANLQATAVGYDGSTLVVPPIAFDGDKRFNAEVTVSAGKVLLLRVNGQVPTGAGQIKRSLTIEMELASRGAFEYGMYSKGPIVIGAGLNYVGASSPDEASMLSAAGGEAISVDSGYIAGDVGVCDAGATVAIGATVGGRIIFGADPPAPTIDGSIFVPFATNIVDAGTDISGGTFTNIRIAAGTNPTFNNSVAILGVMYIEAPNVVMFNNNATITGVIVSEDAGPGADPADHYVYFKNNLSASGLDELPHTSQFAGLHELAGPALLLPGFTLEFKNNFGTISGTIAAQEMILKNNLEAIVYGSIIILGDGGLTFKNNSSITVDRSKYSGLSPGIVPTGPEKLTLRPSSYTEN